MNISGKLILVLFVMFKSIKIYFLMLLAGISTFSSEKSFAMDQELEWETVRYAQAQTTNQVTILEQINSSLINNNFLKELWENHPATPFEKGGIEGISQCMQSAGGGIVNRSLQSFRGETMLVGGGKKAGNGVSDFEELPEIKGLKNNIEYLENGTYNFHLGTGEALNEVTKKVYIEELKIKIKEIQNKIQDTYYTVNLFQDSEPDLVASITNIEDLSTIPHQHFQNVIFEYVPPQVWFCPNIYKNIERILKPQGTLVIEGITQPRLLVVAFEHTKWAGEVNQQLAKDIVFGVTMPSKITLRN